MGLALRGLETLLGQAGLSGCCTLVPPDPDSSDAQGVLQIPAPANARNILPGDVLILEGSALPQAESEADALASLWKRANASACLCVRTDPSQAFRDACARTGLALVRLPDEFSPSRAAKRLALALSEGRGGTPRPKSNGESAPGGQEVWRELPELVARFERATGQPLRTSSIQARDAPRIEAAKTSLQAALDAQDQGLRLLKEARDAVTRLESTDADIPPIASVRRVLAVTSGQRDFLARPLAKDLEYALPAGVDLTELPSSPEAAVRIFSIKLRPEDDRGCREALRSLAAEESLSMGLSDSSEASGETAHALQALQLGQALMGPGHLSSYDNAALYLAYVDDGRSEPLLAFSRRTVEKIREYDERSGDGLLPTLEAYFRNDRNARKTASELGIQRHTLANRLARIEYLTDYPLKGEGRIGYELALALRYWTKARISR